ncbi:hypothetical protein CDAR_270221 [Caerostris darwini]|nr:hypothetical protein CDAR_243821 [Caerostris darwini]GIX83980.1 hypothetical protein CDAR_270201 [Caerostris darwini]GIX83986.1 hypothetical protein CDAR_270221 [Caerostris darwini]
MLPIKILHDEVSIIISFFKCDVHDLKEVDLADFRWHLEEQDLKQRKTSLRTNINITLRFPLAGKYNLEDNEKELRMLMTREEKSLIKRNELARNVIIWIAIVQRKRMN